MSSPMVPPLSRTTWERPLAHDDPRRRSFPHLLPAPLLNSMRFTNPDDPNAYMHPIYTGQGNPYTQFHPPLPIFDPSAFPEPMMASQRFVGQQGRRGVLPSDPGRPEVPADMADSQNLRNADLGPRADGKWPCAHCSKVYLHAKHLKRHLLRHTGERPYMCVLCSDTFCRSDILKRHFSKCSVRRGNPHHLTHLSHASAHVKKSHPGPHKRRSPSTAGSSPRSPIKSETPSNRSSHNFSIEGMYPIGLAKQEGSGDTVFDTAFSQPLTSGVAAMSLTSPANDMSSLTGEADEMIGLTSELQTREMQRTSEWSRASFNFSDSILAPSVTATHNPMSNANRGPFSRSSGIEVTLSFEEEPMAAFVNPAMTCSESAGMTAPAYNATSSPSNGAPAMTFYAFQQFNNTDSNSNSNNQNQSQNQTGAPNGFTYNGNNTEDYTDYETWGRDLVQ